MVVSLAGHFLLARFLQKWAHAFGGLREGHRALKAAENVENLALTSVEASPIYIVVKVIKRASFSSFGAFTLLII